MAPEYSRFMSACSLLIATKRPAFARKDVRP